MLEDHCKHLAVATDTIVLVIASQLHAARPILLFEWCMAMFTTPCPYLFHQPPSPFPDRLALAAPVSTACRGPGVGQSAKVERPLAVRRPLAIRRLFARDQPRLFGMHGEPAPTAPFRQDCHDPARVGFQFEADDTSIGKTPQEAPACDPRLHVLDTPCVQDMMQ